MNGVVVGFSMVVSTFSAVTLISSPAETYYYGAIWTLIAIPYITNVVINCIFLVPFFQRFHFTSGYEVRWCTQGLRGQVVYAGATRSGGVRGGYKVRWCTRGLRGQVVYAEATAASRKAQAVSLGRLLLQ